MFFPRLEPERIEALAKVSGVEVTVIYSDLEGSWRTSKVASRRSRS